mmetsp:Transcript_45971/g.103316  ORF Transcript_45971/g.103316 Transcript_45971/m.103316 type:complete len:219 (-) Transcript_45971:133-789(-)
MPDTTTILPPFNGTLVTAMEEWGISEDVALPVFWTVLAALVVVALLLLASACYMESPALRLSAVLAVVAVAAHSLLLACLVPFPHHVVQGLGICLLLGVLVALGLTLSTAYEALVEEKDPKLTFAVVSCEQAGQEYPFQYVGCDMCGEILGRDNFFSCSNCTTKTKGYELCAKCVPDHDDLHVVFQYKKGAVSGKVDLSIPVIPPEFGDHLKPLVSGS